MRMENVAWIGTGVMGRSMCGHVLEAGYPVSVYTRTRTKAQQLVERGARWAESPSRAAVGAHVVFTMVGFPADVREVYFGPEGILRGTRPGTVLVDMTTTEPGLAIEIAREASAVNAFALDSPVSGGDRGARDATLSIMVGGEEAVLRRVRPLLELMGGSIVHQGPAGSGQHAKMCNQVVIAGTMVGVCEALLYATRSGLDPETVVSSIRGGAAGCWALDNLAPRVIARDFSAGFFVEHFIKDLGIALGEAERMSIPLSGVALAHQLYVSVKALGHGRSGTQALALALENMAGSQKA